MSMIQNLFRESPFEPLRYHMKTVMECVAYVQPMFEAVRDAYQSTLIIGDAPLLLSILPLTSGQLA